MATPVTAAAAAYEVLSVIRGQGVPVQAAPLAAGLIASFAFGVLAWELLAGERPFQRPVAVARLAGEALPEAPSLATRWKRGSTAVSIFSTRRTTASISVRAARDSRAINAPVPAAFPAAPLPTALPPAPSSASPPA